GGSLTDLRPADARTLPLHDALPIYHERVSAQTGDGVLVTHTAAQAQRHFAQQQIAHPVAPGIIQGLEIIQVEEEHRRDQAPAGVDRKSTRLNSSHVKITYAVFCSHE